MYIPKYHFENPKDCFQNVRKTVTGIYGTKMRTQHTPSGRLVWQTSAVHQLLLQADRTVKSTVQTRF